MGRNPLVTTSTHYDLDALVARDVRSAPLPPGMRATLRQGAGGTPDEDPAPGAGAGAADPALVTVMTCYQVGRLLGEGGQGRVFAGTHGFLGREVALKLCSNADDRVTRRFRGEARLTSSLHHPGIIPIYDAADGVLVMQRLTGRTLDTVSGGSSTLATLPALVEALIDVCHALEYAHDRGLLHRDIKAANIVAGVYGEVMLIDWGLAVPLEDGHLPTTFEGLPVAMCSGTPACMPPEVFLGRRQAIGLPADVFLLGALLYQVLTGRLPYQAEDSVEAALQRAREVDYPAVERLNPHAPGRLALLQRQCMERDPSCRPGVGALREGLQHWLRKSGNVEAAAEALALARLLVQRARVCGRRDHELRTDCYIQALAQYDRASALDGDQPAVTGERAQVLQDFISSSVSDGEITLARLLGRHQHLPVRAPGDGRRVFKGGKRGRRV